MQVSWSPSVGATGYMIHYEKQGKSCTERVSGGSTDTHTLTGLQNGATYRMYITATSENFPTPPSVNITLTCELISSKQVHFQCEISNLHGE